MLKYVLFDLDGTLTKSEKGITLSVKYAIEKAGMKVKDGDDLKQFIGPPLIESYKKYYSMTDEQALKALYDYRERYNPVGMFECEVFDGIHTMLELLRKNGVILSTATSKPEEMAVKVADKFGLSERLDYIIGADLSEKNSKADIIKKAFERIGISEDDKKNTVMVGDTELDITGAKECEIKSAGVGYGYGKNEDILKANPDYFVNTVSELQSLLLYLCKNN